MRTSPSLPLTLSGWLVSIGLAGIVAAQEVLRETIPVPLETGDKFRECGLKAFDFRDKNRLLPERNAPAPVPVPSAAIPPPLTASEFYDLLPLLARRDIHPAAGTVVLYEPESRHLFLKATPADMGVLRSAFATTLEEWKDSSFGIGQVLLSVAAWAVPVAGAGRWSLQPQTPPEILALPANSRRLVGRQSLLIRGGQRSKAWGITSSAANGNHHSGMVTEAEVTLNSDNSIADINSAVELCVESADARPAGITRAVYQVEVPVGQSWLVEAWGTPGQNAERIFLIMRADQKQFRSSANVSRWMNGAERPEGERVCRSWEEPCLRLEAPADPFAVERQEKNRAGADEGNVVQRPELFGSLTVRDVTARLAQKSGLRFSPEAAFFVSPETDSWLLFRGPRADAAAFERYYRQVAFHPTPQGRAGVYVLLSAKPETARPEDGETEVVARTLFPVRGGQAATLDLRLPAPGPDGKLVNAASLEFLPQWWDEEMALPGAPRWVAGLTATVGPPLLSSEMTGGDLKATQELPLRQAIGKLPDGRSVILFATVVPSPALLTVPHYGAAPLEEWWRTAAGGR